MLHGVGNREERAASFMGYMAAVEAFAGDTQTCIGIEYIVYGHPNEQRAYAANSASNNAAVTVRGFRFVTIAVWCLLGGAAAVLVCCNFRTQRPIGVATVCRAERSHVAGMMHMR